MLFIVNQKFTVLFLKNFSQTVDFVSFMFLKYRVFLQFLVQLRRISASYSLII